MATLQPPPTWALPVDYNPITQKAEFSPVWLKWFIDLTAVLDAAGGTAVDHNLLTGIQGGTTNQFYHLTATQQTELTDGGETTLHSHPGGGALIVPLYVVPSTLTVNVGTLTAGTVADLS